MNIGAIVAAIEEAAPIARAIASVLAPGDTAAASKAVAHADAVAERAEILAACCVVAFHRSRRVNSLKLTPEENFNFCLGDEMHSCGQTDPVTGMQLSATERSVVDQFYAVRTTTSGIVGAVVP